ncbi:hypothetical protein FisN_21Lh166 [Fistulifera solaris]|uniref:Uncharacterized protein n=1 Tax=Fistulifera solaris TaxID=1519565 RepID=A0A1Z5J937_FISSO|nr:hypothetical protein FisN_21Lh166 [Fistulifera solaris]|eukprot:GAX10469.1 hypothetical protein FisN_21Lh166 [Fistulifera solaris]
MARILVWSLLLVIGKQVAHSYNTQFQGSRRDWINRVALTPFIATTSIASAATGPTDGNLPELPPEAVRSYLQYRIPLQTSSDFYIFELRELLEDINSWGEVGELFQANNNRGQGNPSRIEREFTNVFRILGLSMPPEYAEEMRDAQFAFERAMGKISKATAGVRRDLPVELDKSLVPTALEGWEEGRVALNSFFVILNNATGLKEMHGIPPYGPNQKKEYGRSERRYLDLKKKVKLCQNRGGPTLSQAWGQLMVSGYLQDSCGIPDLDAYFYQ